MCRAFQYIFSPILILSLLSAGCSTTRHKNAADKETYAIIQQKTTAVPGMESDFSIDTDKTWQPLENLGTVQTADPALGEASQTEVGASIINLEQALRIAVRQNRRYQSQKESLYLAALSLTLDRHRYTPIFSGGAGADYNRSVSDVVKNTAFGESVTGGKAIIDQIEVLTGTPATLLNDYATVVEGAGDLLGVDQTRSEIANERSVSGDTSVGVNMLLKGGGALALSLTSNFFRFLTGDPATATSSMLTASFTQPLLDGAGRKVAAERLTQAERDVLYSLRDFTRFRKQFFVDICAAYYGVLQNRDEVSNNFRSYQSFERNAERERDFAVEGRSTIAFVGRQEQGVLDAQNRWINAIRRYNESLDNFKILLGLSTDAPIVLDNLELQTLRDLGLKHPGITAEDAVKVALVTRLDLYSSRDVADDAERRVYVAANALKPGLDLLLAAGVPSEGGDNFQELDFRRSTWSAGLDLDLPLNKKAERNAYRAALITAERAFREYTLAEDTVKLSVRGAWRNLEQARRNYDIALKSLELNLRRVREQELLADLGRGSVLDQVDSQDALTSSENSLTAALVAHTIARVELWRDMGILYIKKDGQWEEITDG